MTAADTVARVEVLAPELLDYVVAAGEGRLSLPACRTCGQVAWPARPRCGVCGSDQFEPRDVTLAGRLYSWTTTHRAPIPDLPIATPYTVVIVALDEPDDVRVLGRWFEPGLPELSLDLPVVAVVDVDQAGLPILLWRRRD